MIYLDAAATSPVRREVLEAMWPYLTGDFGNPSSHHAVGESAARGLADARAAVAEWLGCRASEVTFTSGGTEADNLAVKGIALANPRGRHLVTTPIEHEAVLESVDHLVRLHGFEATIVPVGRDGLVDPAAFAAALRPDTTLASVMLANNEVGTVQPIAVLSTIAHEHGIPFHTDAVQAAGWLPLDVRTLGVDALSVSGHKLGAPKGVGALYVKGRIPLEPVIHGGGQERGRRSGTENVAGAVALATAARLSASGLEERATAAAAARDAFVAAVLAEAPGASLTGHPTSRLPGTASFVFPGINGEAVLLELERRGVVSSSGSACAAGSEDASHVLLALGYPEDVARTAVRFSWGPEVTAGQLAAVAPAVGEAVRAVAGLGG
ncbi:cysteine desulfurase family protein [Leifsonia sp. 21MFCrub1.1]|uniref:cysteine desulfurase family protein n=1 Tax=Leifsonia sp. 21MFCrub1.1 TaxID=1798223 RepID=UPI0008928A52|nr:cysteine desulfurase family protein [Leifsonia sp. 21MFCrub1.1]SEA69093.1 cysteine desulfurase [Leifsonia sp. 21MFCrub1.1]